MIRRAGVAVSLVAAVGLLAGCASAPAATHASGKTAEAVGKTAPKPSAPTGSPTPAPGAGAGEPTSSPQPDDPSQLPQGLAAAVERDLGISPQHYLDQAQTAVTASDILPALEKSGVTASDVWIDDTTIHVHTANAAQAEAAAALGANPTSEEPPAAPDITQPVSSYDTLDNGQGWYLDLDANFISICSTGFNGYRAGAKTLVTAGHCLLANSPVPADPVTAYRYNQTKPNQDATAAGLPIGTLDRSSFQFGGGRDAGLIPVTGAAQTPRPLTSTWNGGTLPVRGTITATNGASICKSGRTTGWSCGKVIAVNVAVTVDDTQTVNSVVTSMCMYHGDSGGAAMIGNYAVGINSAGSWSSAACTDSGAISTVFPVQGSTDSVLGAHPDWEPAVQLDAPTVATSAGASGSATISGSLTNSTTADKVIVSVDGAATPAGAASVAANGTWSLPVASLAAGMHTVQAVAAYGANSRSTATSQAVRVGTMPSSRIAGVDRYETAARVSAAAYPSTTGGTVYLASGLNFPDALVAGPAAAADGGPVLLTKATSVPDVIATELKRLAPKRVVIVGGTGAVSADVGKQLTTILPGVTVERRSGADRYASARAVITGAYSGKAVTNLYIATGQNFPDSLSAASAGASNGSPVLTVPGTASSLDATTVAFITSLNPGSVSVVGGTASVSAGIYTQLSNLVGSAKMHRYAGLDRYATAQSVAQSAFPTGDPVYLANGLNYPDALVGAALSGAKHQPMMLTAPTCVSAPTALAMGGWKTTTITLLGGTGSLSAAVAAMTRC